MSTSGYSPYSFDYTVDSSGSLTVGVGAYCLGATTFDVYVDDFTMSCR